MEKLQGLFWYVDFDNYFLGHQFAEILKDRIYAPYLENIKNATVIDVGANLGAFSLYASKYAKQVYAIEPALIHFNAITEMLKFNGITNVKLIKKAIFIENKEFPLFQNPNLTIYSLHTAVDAGQEPPEKVTAITLDQLFDDEKIEHCHLLRSEEHTSEL